LSLNQNGAPRRERRHFGPRPFGGAPTMARHSLGIDSVALSSGCDLIRSRVSSTRSCYQIASDRVLTAPLDIGHETPAVQCRRCAKQPEPGEGRAASIRRRHRRRNVASIRKRRTREHRDGLICASEMVGAVRRFLMPGFEVDHDGTTHLRQVHAHFIADVYSLNSVGRELQDQDSTAGVSQLGCREIPQSGDRAVRRG
jgi:hypothetical protein